MHIVNHTFDGIAPMRKIITMFSDKHKLVVNLQEGVRLPQISHIDLCYVWQCIGSYNVQAPFGGTNTLLFGDGHELGRRWRLTYEYFQKLPSSGRHVAHAWSLIRHSLPIAERLEATGA